MAVMELEGVWKTERVKLGVRLLEVEDGDVIRVGSQAFRIVKTLASGKFLVRNVIEAPERGRGASSAELLRAAEG